MRGMSLVEVIVGLAAAILLMLMASVGVVQIGKLNKSVSTSIIENRQLSSILENVRRGVGQYQVHFANDNESKDIALRYDNLKMAWDSNLVLPAEECTECPGRLGYVIQPHPTLNGLYLVTLRFTHRNWENTHRDYVFAVAPR